MNYHNKIINLSIPGNWRNDYNSKTLGDLKEGHKCARHAAAEIANEADAIIAELLAALEEIVARNEIQHWFNLDQARAAIAKAKEKEVTNGNNIDRKRRIAELEAQLADAERNDKVLQTQLANCHDTMRKDGVRHAKALLALEDAEAEAQREGADKWWLRGLMAGYIVKIRNGDVCRPADHAQGFCDCRAFANKMQEALDSRAALAPVEAMGKEGKDAQ